MSFDTTTATIWFNNVSIETGVWLVEQYGSTMSTTATIWFNHEFRYKHYNFFSGTAPQVWQGKK